MEESGEDLTLEQIEEGLKLRAPKHTSVGLHACDPTVAHKVNTVIDFMLQELERLPGPIPPNLVLQLDNAGGQNKNNHLILFMMILVHYKIFKKVRITFLPVGHTHCDIDQMFSKISTYLGTCQILDIDELLECLEQSFSPIPNVQRHTRVPDYKAYIDLGKYERINGISRYQVFKIESTEKGVSLRMKAHDYDGKNKWTAPLYPLIEAPPFNPLKEGGFFWDQLRTFSGLENLRDNWTKWIPDVPEGQEG